MKSNFYNPSTAIAEQQDKLAVAEKEDKRKMFFAGLKKNRAFQQYVVEELIKANISNLNDNSKILDTKRSKEDLADLVIANIKASQTLTNILSKLL